MKTEGLVEGQNVVLEFRSAEGQYDRLPALAAELVNRKVSVIVAERGRFRAFSRETSNHKDTDRFFYGQRSVRWGLVASLNQPGGNITGVVHFCQRTIAKTS